MGQGLLVGMIPAFALISALVLGVAVQPAADGRSGVAVLTPPWRGAEAVVAAAGGTVLPLPGAPLSVIAAGPEPGFAARLRAAGAWAVLPADAKGFLCGE